jgi:hypothetical protein
MALGDGFSSLLSFPDLSPSEAERLNNAMAQQAMAQQAILGQQHNAQLYQKAPNSPQAAPVSSPSVRARKLFIDRMGGVRNEFQVARDDFIWVHVYADMAYVFFCFAGKEGVTKEQLDIFPSDQLITQFRMILA